MFALSSPCCYVWEMVLSSPVSKVRRVITWLIPPILPLVWQKIVRRDLGLFEGEGDAFKQLAMRASVYGEYGVGESTLWVANNTQARVLAVETDGTWVERVKQSVSREEIQIIHADLGPVGDYGRPVDYQKFDSFPDYFEGIWNGGSKPDLVLIDGRFRVACFLTSLLFCEEGTIIIFDDYKDRSHYHIVERVIAPSAVSGRQAIFNVELEKLNKELILEIRLAFWGCMD